MKPNRFVPTLIFLIIIAAGCATSGKSTLEGVIDQVEIGKDGVQVALLSDDQLYSVTISELQTEIDGGFDQILMGAEIEVSGKEIAGMDPPLIVADTVRIIEGPHPLVGSAWVISSYNGQQPLSGYEPTMKFEANRISGSTGCNLYSGAFQIKDDRIEFDGVQSTEMACLDPEGLMDQEQIFLEILRGVVRFSLTDEELVLIADVDRHLKFLPSDFPVTGTPAGDDNETVSVEALGEVPEDQVPSWEYNRYLDAETGISILIPETWIGTGIIEGEYAILQSYPEDKYVGGEPFEEGDSKCDFRIQPPGMQADALIKQWKTDGFTTIISENEILLNSGIGAKRYELDSMGLSTVLIAEIGERVVVLSCFGNVELFDDIAMTLSITE